MNRIKKLIGSLNPKLAKQVAGFLVQDRFTYFDTAEYGDEFRLVHEALLEFLEAKLSATSINFVLSALGVVIEQKMIEQSIKAIKRIKDIEKLVEFLLLAVTKKEFGEFTYLLLQLLFNEWLYKNGYSLMVFNNQLTTSINDLLEENVDFEVIKETFVTHYKFSNAKNKTSKLRTTPEIIEEILNLQNTLRLQFGITRLALFGSYLKGTQTEFSDLDVFIETKDVLMKFKLKSIQDYLSAILKIEIDVTTDVGFINYEVLEVF